MSLHQSQVLTRTGNERWQSTLMDRHGGPFAVAIQAFSPGEPPYAVRDSKRMLIAECMTLAEAAEIIVIKTGADQV